MARADREKVHLLFEVGLALKAVHAVFELIAGVAIALLPPQKLGSLAVLLTRHELIEDPKDFVANFLLRTAHSFSLTTQHFLLIYLVSHGAIKLILILLLYKKKLWAYPLTVISLILFIAYQVSLMVIKLSPLILALTLFDLVMIALTIAEYKNVKRRKTV